MTSPHCVLRPPYIQPLSALGSACRCKVDRSGMGRGGCASWREGSGAMAVRRQRPDDAPPLVAVGRRMPRLREAKEIKQETFAPLTKGTPGQVSRSEVGKKRATRSFGDRVDD